MKQVLIWILLLALGAGAFAALVLSRGWSDSMMMAVNLDPDSGLVLGAIKLTAPFLIGIPVAGLIFSLLALGSNAGGEDLHGYKVLRIRSGARYFLAAACLALAGLFFLVAAEGHIALQIGMKAIGLLFLFAGLWTFFARIRYDNSTLFITAYSGATRRFDWADLDRIETNREAMEYHLTFREGQKARVSYFYQGLEGLISTAYARLEQNHA